MTSIWQCREEVYGEKAKTSPMTLMDHGAPSAAKILKKRGILPDLDESRGDQRLLGT